MADASPSPGSPSNLNSTSIVGPMSRSNLDPMTSAMGSNLDPMMSTMGSNLDPMTGSMGPLGLGGVGTMGRMGRSSEQQRRPGSGEVFPSDLQVHFFYLFLYISDHWTFPGINLKKGM